MKSPRSRHAFTLIELLTVITIISILMGLLFAAMTGVTESGRKVKAKNDLVQIVSAVKAYYTEYGKYPVKEGGTGGDDTFSGDNDRLFNVLRPLASATGYDLNMNSRRITFMEVPTAKQLAHATAKGGLCDGGHFHDPWGSVYSVLIDGNYDNQLTNPYTGNSAGFATLDTGVIAWSLGKDRAGGSGNKTTGTTNVDDIISWQ